MGRTKNSTQKTSRVARHRKKVTRSGARRVEVTIPSRDAVLIKAVAGSLRSGGEEAKRIREMLQAILTLPKAKTGKELVAFFRSSPLAGVDIEFERDRSTGRCADLG